MGAPKASEVLEVIADAAVRSLDSDRLAEEFLDAFGGSKKFFSILKAEHDNPKTPAMARVKILEGGLRLLQQSAAKKAPAFDLAGMTQDDLLNSLAPLLAKIKPGGEPDVRVDAS